MKRVITILLAAAPLFVLLMLAGCGPEQSNVTPEMEQALKQDAKMQKQNADYR